jgi:tripartite-type tricarboxylate transporter receptor subunit TctC
METLTMTPLSRRRLLGHALAAALLPLAAAGPVLAQEPYPSRPIKWVLPYLAGTGPDITARILAEAVGPVLGQPVVIENKAGAGGIIGSQLVAKAPPDGYTLVVSGIGSHVIAPANGGVFDPLTDFTHIAMLGGPPIALVVNAQQPWKDVASFVAAAQKPGDGISYATPGKGTHGHLTAELFRAALKLNLTHVSYKGAGPAVTDLLANQVPAGFMTLSSANAHVNSGKLRLLAVTAPKRLPEYPNTPTFEELGYPKLTGTTWFALSGPPGMPPAIVEKINAEVRRGMQTPAIQAQLKAESMVTADYTPAQFQHYIVTELERWGNPARAVLAGK